MLHIIIGGAILQLSPYTVMFSWKSYILDFLSCMVQNEASCYFNVPFSPIWNGVIKNNKRNLCRC